MNISWKISLVLLFSANVFALDHPSRVTTISNGNVSGGGVAGFTREKTLEMRQFNDWRTQTPEGKSWEYSRQHEYRHPGDPRDNYEAPYIYKGNK